MARMTTDDRLLTVDEVAHILRRHPVTVRRNLRAGVLPGRRIGGRWLVAAADLETLTAPQLERPA